MDIATKYPNLPGVGDKSDAYFTVLIRLCYIIKVKGIFFFGNGLPNMYELTLCY